ncbi:hypothetical protein PTKIN_Ptkin17bG0152400 [Pterospermum kingtungense]
MFLLLFLFVSVQLELIEHPLTLQHRIRLRITSGFSIAFTSSFIASFFFPPSHPLALFFEIFKQILGWFSGVPQSTPIYVITIITGNHEGPDRVQLQEDEELGAMQQHHQA